MGLEHLGIHCQWRGSPLHSWVGPPDNPSARTVGLRGGAISWNSVSLFLSYLCPYSPFSCQLGSGRAGSEMTGSQGLGALCSGFLSTQFHTAHGLAATQLETCQNSIKSQGMSEQYENTCHPSPACSPGLPRPSGEGPSWPVSLISPPPP